MGILAHDLRLAFRSLFRHPGLTVVAVLTMSLGVGASTSMFTLLHRVVIRPLPYPEADHIVRLYTADAQGSDRGNWSGANFVDFVAQSTSYQAIAGFVPMRLSVREGAFPVEIPAASVTPAFFQVLGEPPQLGRVLSPASDPPGGERVVVLSHSLWVTRFAADPSVIGRPLALNGEAFTVVGVMPQGFEFPDHTQLWSASRFRSPEPPVPIADDPVADRGSGYFHVVARLQNGVSLPHAMHEAELIAARLEKDYPDTNLGERFVVVPLQETIVGSVRPALLALFGAVGLVLLIACANVANLLLARAAGRAHEIAIRTALGAGRGRVARQLLTESALLGVLGGAGGVVLAFVATHGLVSLAASDLPRAAEVSMDLPVLGFALGVSILSGLLFGLAPVIWLTKSDPATTLRAAGGRGLVGSSYGHTRTALVVAEMAVCLSLLVGAGLLARTLAMLTAQDPGFSESRALTARIFIPGTDIPNDREIRTFQSQVLERMRALPGVISVGAVLSLPIDPGIRGTLGFNIEGRSFEKGSEPVAGYQSASDGYFKTIGIPVLQGRAFTPADGPGGAPVVVVSQAFAERFFPGENPLGKRIAWGDPEDEGFEWSTVVGVVGNTRFDGLDAEPRVEAYQPMAQAPLPFMTVVLRTSVPPATLTEPLRRAVAELRPSQPVQKIQTMEQVLHDSLARRRFTMVLLWIFASLALTLAAVGLYGVVSFSVAQRSREFGVRMAVGAAAGHILVLVVKESSRVLVAGLLVGGVTTLILGRLITGFLFQVTPTDPLTLVAAAVVLAAVTFLATWIPARRATRIDPMVALRIE